MSDIKREVPLLQVADLTKHFPAPGGKTVHAVDGVSFEIPRGTTLGLVGESGCGKSTCARTIIRIYQPTRGNVYLDGVDTSTLSNREMLPFRRSMQMIFQDPYASLNARMTVHDIIAEPLRAHKVCANRREESERIAYMLSQVGLNGEHANRYAHEFSGGQRQRIGIARALILQPKFVICDEPISALDVSIQAQIVNMLRDFQERQGLTYLFIAHDLSMVRYVSDAVGVMYLGKLVELSRADDIYAHPLHPYTQGLLASIPIPNPRLAQQKTTTGLEGDLPSPINLPSGCRFHTRCPYADERCRSECPVLRDAGGGHQVACHRVNNA